LGSFPIHLEPRRLDGVERIQVGDTSTGVSLRPNVSLDGSPLELLQEDVQEIRSWLLAHGSCAKREADNARWRERQEQVRAEERVRLEVQIRAELREEVRAELQEKIQEEMESRRSHPVEEAIRSVQAAGRAVHEEADRLKAVGHKMLTRRGRPAAAGESPVHRLLDLTLALRQQAFAGFEDECKAAGLMGHKPKPSKAKRLGKL